MNTVTNNAFERCRNVTYCCQRKCEFGDNTPARIIMRDFEENLDEINLGLFVQNFPLEHFEVLLNLLMPLEIEFAPRHFLNFFEAT